MSKRRPRLERGIAEPNITGQVIQETGEEVEKRLECSSEAPQVSRWASRCDISLVKIYLFTMLNTLSRAISSLPRHVLRNPQVPSASWIMQSGVQSSSALLRKLHILEDAGRLAHSLADLIACVYAHPSSSLCLLCCLQSPFDVELLENRFESALSVTIWKTPSGIYLTMRSL